MGEKHEVTVERNWQAAGIRTVKVDGVNGSLSVQAGPGDRVELVARVKSRGVSPSKDKPNFGFFESIVEGDTLRIAQKRSRVTVSIPFFRSDELQIDYDLMVPPSAAIDLKTVNGRIAARGISGEATMTTVNGTIDAEIGGEHEVSAKSVNGRIRAKFVTGFAGARLKTVNGGVEAILPQSASFTCNLSQVNGDFEATFPLSIHSNPGGRRVSGEVNGGRYQLQITTVNGDVEVQHIPPPPPPPAPPALPPAPTS
ncbi:MAG: DUF4097 family beta strand repeat protein [Thermoanaerobaculia bacterium]|nr:DUF4097 family beta strand repeat protein [Thermoanaerobaculia bacterium]